MMYYLAENIPILSRDDKEIAFILFLWTNRQTDRQTDTQTESKTENNR